MFFVSTRRDYIPLLKQDALIAEAIKLIDCTYEDKTSWGKEIGLIYGSATEDVMTGLVIQSRGWRSVACTPFPPAFLGCAPTTSEDALTTRKRWSMGLLEILFNTNSPFLVKNTKGLTPIQRIIYIYFVMFPLMCFPLFTYAVLPALSLLTESPFLPKVDDPAIVIPISLFVWVYWSSYYENTLVGMGSTREWWNNERMECIAMVSSNAFATFEMLKKILGLSETTFVVTPKDQNLVSKSSTSDDSTTHEQQQQQEGFVVNNNSYLFIPPTTLVLLNAAGLVSVIAHTCLNLLGGCSWMGGFLGVRTWPPVVVEAACAMWVLFVLQPFTKGLFLWCQGQKGPLALHSSTVLRSSLVALALFVVFVH